jgi:oxygen-dependent protoporphyrinogen oxidase
MARDICIVGGGIAGLSCAWRLFSAGRDVIVVEERDVAGGNIRTRRDGPYLMEYGPHTFMGSASDVFKLAAEVGAEGDIVPTRPAASARFIVRGGRMHAAPTGLFSFLFSDLLGFGSKLRLMTEPFRTGRGQPSDTAMQFFERRFGSEAARVLAGAFVSGVYAGDAEKLSAAAAFPLFWRFEQESGGMIRGALKLSKERKLEREASGAELRKGLFSFKGGMGRLSAAAARKLGGNVLCSSKAESISRVNGGFKVITGAGEIACSRIVLAVPPHEAARLVRPLDAGASSLLEAIPMAPVAVSHLGYAARAENVPDGFGFLAPRGEGPRSLGVLFPSRIFEDRAPPGGDLFTGFVGGVSDPQALGLPDGDIAGVVIKDLNDLTGLKARPELESVHRVEKAIPQLVLGHLERISGINAGLARLPGITLAGNYLKGVGMKDAIASGFEAAEAIADAGRPGGA